MSVKSKQGANLRKTETATMSASVLKKEPYSKPKSRKKWKKPKDKPNRPLSAYNIFFRSERANLMNELKQSQNKFGKVGFAALAKHIASKWKQLGPESRKTYEAQAQIEQQKYKVLLTEWRRKQEQGYDSSSNSTVSSSFSNSTPDLPTSNSKKASLKTRRSNSLPLPNEECYPASDKTLLTRRTSVPLVRITDVSASQPQEWNYSSHQNLPPLFVSSELASHSSHQNLPPIQQGAAHNTFEKLMPIGGHSIQQGDNTFEKTMPIGCHSMGMRQDHTLYHGTVSPPQVDTYNYQESKVPLPCISTNFEPPKDEAPIGHSPCFDILVQPYQSDDAGNMFQPKHGSSTPDWEDEADLGDLYQFLKTDTNLLDP